MRCRLLAVVALLAFYRRRSLPYSINRPRSFTLLPWLGILAFGLLGAMSATAAPDDVLTQHNDPARSGAQLHETVLKPGIISATTFGRLYERHVDGQIIAQPLYAGGLAIPG